VSSESGYDFLRFYIDGVEQTRISGEVDWTQKTYSIASGSHTLKWAYTKDGSVSSGSDAGWLDYVVFTGSTCTYSISPTSASFGASGGSGSVSVTAPSGCSWTAGSNASWITITSGSSGSGNGTVSYSVAANTSTSSRTGTMTIAGQTFTVTQAGTGSGISLGEAVDNASLTWTTGGNANWYGQNTVYYYGGDAARSGAITHNQSSWIQTTVTGPGTLTFYWKVSSESGYDFLRFYIDGVEQTRISGEVNWTQKTYSIASGSHTLKWAYTKDGSVSSGSDAGWLDYVVFVGGPTSITILFPNGGQNLTVGSTPASVIRESSAGLSPQERVRIDLFAPDTETVITVGRP
jgi:hypothetical protein